MTRSAELFTSAALLLYCGAAVAYALMWWRSGKPLRLAALSLVSAGGLLNAYQLLHRWLELGQPPFRTIYETLILLGLSLVLVYLAIELIFRARVLGLPSTLGCVATMAYALTLFQKAPVNLPPALQSGWFIPHVVIYFFGYAAFFVAAGAALLYLLRPRPIELRRPDLIEGGVLDLSKTMDACVRFGFAMITLGLLIGALWARVAWSDYWTWDPKETWSLVTWLVFATYLHGQYLAGWRGRRLAIIVLLGFAAVLFTYLGMSLLPTAQQSLHVYQ